MSFIKSIGWTIITIIIICISGKVFAGVREILIAKYFGIGAITDSFVVAASIPCRLGLMVGMMSYTAFIPVFSKYLLIDKKDAYRFFNTCFAISIFVLILMTLSILPNSSRLIQLLAPGLSFSSKIVAAKLLQIMVGALALLGISSLFRAINSINQRYIISSIYDPSANFITLIMMIILIPFIGIYGLAIGILLGAIGQFLIQGSGFLKSISFDNFKVDFRHPGIKMFLISFFLLLGAVIIVETNYFIMRRIASMLPAGSIAALNFAFTVTHLPVSILDLIIITMLFPLIATLVNQNRLNEIGQITSDIVKATIFALLPLSAFFIIFRTPIIEILFQRGAFDLTATQKTSIALGFFSIGLFAWGLDYVLFRIYYLIKEMRIYISILAFRVVLNVILNIVLARYLMHGGIALAFSIALIVHLIFLMIFLRRKLTHFNIRGIGVFSLKATLICIIMVLGIYFTGYMFNNYLMWGTNFVWKLLHIGISGIIGLAIYLLCARLVMAKELGLFRDLFRLRTVKLTSFVMNG